MSGKWRVWHPDPAPRWANRTPGEPEPFGHPEIKWGGLRARCPECHQGMPTGMYLFMGYTMHVATAHLGIPVFSAPWNRQEAPR